MSLPVALVEAVAAKLGQPIQQSKSLGGGCIAHATRIETAGGPFFLKYGRGEVAETFAVEAVGLGALDEAGSPLVIPEVLTVQPENETCPGFLLLEWIEPGAKSTAFWQDFGIGLADLHRYTAERCGFEQDNFIGRLPQRNTWERSWIDFYRKHRLEPQVQRARAGGRWQRAWDHSLSDLYHRLPDLLPENPPASILHGDLWSGNFLVARSGTAALIDPATYYGHREADLAMTELFGGFADDFYEAYRAAWSLEPGYTERRDIYNLYHLINHLNLFGGGYAGAVASILKKFG
ncbi:MAG TPA: fructosamine kinase family protein [Rhodothermales bacterium]|nr:fructosamine kinase family protein [Rhodothermales bacterium]